MKVTLIGVDCATVSSKVGLALASMEDSRPRVLKTTTGHRIKSIDGLASFIASWIPEAGPTLLALDAPLGWPTRLGETLVHHSAGMPLSTEADQLFSRYTDHFVHTKIGKKPLEVGANLIARTAHAALDLLQKLRKLTGQPIPLAWNRHIKEGLSAIEVYPAATLLAHKIIKPRYKKEEQGKKHQDIFNGLAERLVLPEYTALLTSNADALDAVVCVLAAADFLSGKTFAPLDKKLAQKEGWIWVCDPTRLAP
jgi:predicted RNase H-like nuclease